MTIIQMPATTMQGVGMGQSLGAGEPGPAVLSIAQSAGNLKLFDSSGTYDITAPNAGTLSAVGLVAPQRTIGAGGQYGDNIKGESVDVACANTIRQLALYDGASPFSLWSTCIAQVGQSLNGIKKGGTVNAYAAGLYEARAALRLRSTLATMYVLLTHGESDASLATYAVDTNTGICSVVQADYAAITGQVTNLVKAHFQQNSTPIVSAFGPPVSALQQLVMHTSGFSSLIGPEYQYPSSGAQHKTAAGYLRMGEKAGQVIWSIFKGGSWSPLRPTAFSVVGAVATITFAVPVAPIVLDTSFTNPHATGNLSGWANGSGIEATELPVTITAATAATPIVCTATGHGWTNGRTCITNLPGITGGNGAFVIANATANTFELAGTTGGGSLSSSGTGEQVVDITSTTAVAPNQLQVTLGRVPSTGLAIANAYTVDSSNGGFGCNRGSRWRDSDPFIGPFSGVANPNFAAAFKQTGLT